VELLLSIALFESVFFCSLLSFQLYLVLSLWNVLWSCYVILEFLLCIFISEICRMVDGGGGRICWSLLGSLSLGGLWCRHTLACQRKMQSQ
jgi:hypothetical protein